MNWLASPLLEWVSECAFSNGCRQPHDSTSLPFALVSSLLFSSVTFCLPVAQARRAPCFPVAGAWRVPRAPFAPLAPLAPSKPRPLYATAVHFPLSLFHPALFRVVFLVLRFRHHDVLLTLTHPCSLCAVRSFVTHISTTQHRLFCFAHPLLFLLSLPFFVRGMPHSSLFVSFPWPWAPVCV